MNLIDVDAAAAMLGMSVSWLRKRTGDGSISFVKLGKAVRFDPATLTAWLHRHACEVIDAAGTLPAAPVPSGEQVLDIAGAAELLGMSVSWLYKATSAGAVPHFKIGKVVRFDPARLRAWATSHARAA